MIADFVEEQLDLGIDYGVEGGPEFVVEIVEMGSRREVRNVPAQAGLGSWEAGDRNITDVILDYLLTFYRARRGMGQGFRFKDWQDYFVTDEALSPDGSASYQLTKTYETSGEADVRNIYKPIASTFSMQRNGGAFAAYSLDDTTGIITLTPDDSFAISAISKAANGQVTAVGHTYSNGDEIDLSGIGGMTELNGVVATISGVAGNNFNLNIDTSTFGTYTSGGLARKFVQSSETLSWTGDFDVVARFDGPLRARFEAFKEGTREAIYYLSPLPIKEYEP